MKLTPALLLMLVIAACGRPAPPANGTAPTPAFVPASIEPGETDCGTFPLDQGQGLAESAMQCIISAAAQGRQARLQEKRLTVEGDPIFTLYRVKPGGAVEVKRDTTHDRFGNQGIVVESCTGPVVDHGMLTFAHCAP
jgi:hypothetical protein